METVFGSPASVATTAEEGDEAQTSRAWKISKNVHGNVCQPPCCICWTFHLRFVLTPTMQKNVNVAWLQQKQLEYFFSKPTPSKTNYIHYEYSYKQNV